MAPTNETATQADETEAEFGSRWKKLLAASISAGKAEGNLSLWIAKNADGLMTEAETVKGFRQNRDKVVGQMVSGGYNGDTVKMYLSRVLTILQTRDTKTTDGEYEFVRDAFAQWGKGDGVGKHTIHNVYAAIIALRNNRGGGEATTTEQLSRFARSLRKVIHSEADAQQIHRMVDEILANIRKQESSKAEKKAA